jgi:HSP20 family protein
MTLTHWQKPNVRGTSAGWGAKTLQDGLSRLVQAFEASLGADQPFPFNAQWLPAVDLYENKDLVTVRAEIPGTKKEDINISLQDGFLVLSGERKETRNYETSGPARSERFQGRFQRAVRLPYQVDAKAIKAAYTDGILTVELPKAEEAKPKQIKINVN